VPAAEGCLDGELDLVFLFHIIFLEHRDWSLARARHPILERNLYRDFPL